MSKKAKESKQIRREQIKERTLTEIKLNQLKIRECLKNGQVEKANHYSALNKKLREMIAC